MTVIRMVPVLLFCLAGVWAAPMVFDRVVAVVDEEIILWSDIEKLDEALRFQPPFSSQSPETRRAQILQRLIDDKVLLAAAARDTTIVVATKEVEAQAKSHLDRLLEQYGGEERLGAALQQSEGLTLAEFRERMKREVREQLQKQRLQQKFVGEVSPSNQDVRSFYERYRDSLPVLADNYHVSHLELAIQPDSVGDRRARQLCDSLLGLLGKGVAFDHLAANFSDDPGGAEGGDLGYTRRGTLDPEYEKAAFALNLGEYSLRPVRSQYGWHVIKLTGRKDTEVRTSHILIMVVSTVADTLRTLSRHEQGPSGRGGREAVAGSSTARRSGGNLAVDGQTRSPLRLDHEAGCAGRTWVVRGGA